jgi:hypothetical protein
MLDGEVRVLKEKEKKIQKSLNDIKMGKQHINKIFTERKAQLIDSKPEFSSLYNNLIELASQITLLEEAQPAVKKILLSINTAIITMKSAKTWGVFDILGGGIISTAIKHSRIKDAKYCLAVIQDDLNQYIKITSQFDSINNSFIDLHIGSIEKFGDYFFDGIIFDWVVQSKLKSVLSQLSEFKDSTTQVMEAFEEKICTCKSEKEDLEARINAIIEREIFPV